MEKMETSSLVKLNSVFFLFNFIPARRPVNGEALEYLQRAAKSTLKTSSVNSFSRSGSLMGVIGIIQAEKEAAEEA